MKSFIVFALFVAVAAGAAISPVSEKDAVITEHSVDNIGVGGYSYVSKTSNGIVQEERAVLKNAGSENEAIEVTGGFAYPGPDGVIYQVKYIANEFGFQPEAAHLPQAPVA